MNKGFDCVSMKHKGAELVRKETRGMSRQKELEFWRKRTENLLRRKRAFSTKS